MRRRMGEAKGDEEEERRRDARRVTVSMSGAE